MSAGSENQTAIQYKIDAVEAKISAKEIDSTGNVEIERRQELAARHESAATATGPGREPNMVVTGSRRPARVGGLAATRCP